MTIAAVILAAGASRRLGRPKQDIVLDGQTLLERAIGVAQQASLFPVVVVLREPRPLASFNQEAVRILHNQAPDEGMASSVRLGIGHLAEHNLTGAIVLTCDQPLLRADHLRLLAADPSRVTGSGYGGRVGVPAYFPSRSFPQLLALQGDAGARALLRDAAAVPDEALLLDIDTTADLAAAEAIFALRQANG